MHSDRGALAGSLACLLAATCAARGTHESQPGLHPEVARADIEAHVRFLASDELAGRCTGTPEAERAARYLSDALERCGVEPAGEGGTFLLPVPLHRIRTVAAPELTLAARSGTDGEEKIEAVYRRDFETSEAAIAVEGLKVVVARSATEIPKEPDARVAMFIDASDTQAKRWLEEAGHPEGQGFGLWIRAGLTNAGAEAAFTPRESGLRRLPGNTPQASVKMRGPLLDRLRHGEIQSLSLRTHVEDETVRAFNVVGRILGAGLPGEPDLARETVVVSAHYDHLPPQEKEAGSASGPPDGKDRIYNGADDDASGCAAVLEIAGALGAGKKPARTVVFFLATGEEEGLLGTNAYLDHPVVPLAQTVANLNVEMIGRPDPMVGGPGTLWLTGFERTDLGPAFADAGLPVKADPRPDQHFFERSDNYAFVLRGIVGQTFSSYNLHADYHTPADEADKLDYAHMESCTRALLQAVRLVADGKLRPRWVEGREPKHR